MLGLPDERYGEAVHAVLRLRDQGISRATLDAWCRARLANYKVPKRFHLMDAFPLLPNGKIDRVGTRHAAAALPVLD